MTWLSKRYKVTQGCYSYACEILQLQEGTMTICTLANNQM